MASSSSSSSSSYNARLKTYPNKGLCGDDELFDSEEEVKQSVKELASLIRNANSIVCYTGAGVSTSSGIPDFRGPQGVWTRELQGRPAPPSLPFEKATPSITHMALVRLMEMDRLDYIVTQNVDSLHLRSGVPRSRVAELHGNIFMERCDRCGAEYLRPFDVGTVGFTHTGRHCDECGGGDDDDDGGALRDMVLDWDSELPQEDMDRAIQHTKEADLCLVLGTSLRIRPAGNFPMRTVRRNGKPTPGKLVIVNLQQTHLDRECTIRIHARCDDVMRMLMNELQYKIPVFPYKSTLVARTIRGVPLGSNDDDDDG